jgi:hypothetical protein
VFDTSAHPSLNASMKRLLTRNDVVLVAAKWHLRHTLYHSRDGEGRQGSKLPSAVCDAEGMQGL